MTQMQLLTTVSTQIDAEIIKEKLFDAGIESFMQSDDLDNMMPAMDYASGVKIFVIPDDFEKATWLITNSEDDLTDDMEVGGGD
jgi:hypothetical protein